MPPQDGRPESRPQQAPANDGDALRKELQSQQQNSHPHLKHLDVGHQNHAEPTKLGTEQHVEPKPGALVHKEPKFDAPPHVEPKPVPKTKPQPKPHHDVNQGQVGEIGLNNNLPERQPPLPLITDGMMRKGMDEVKKVLDHLSGPLNPDVSGRKKWQGINAAINALPKIDFQRLRYSSLSPAEDVLHDFSVPQKTELDAVKKLELADVVAAKEQQLARLEATNPKSIDIALNHSALAGLYQNLDPEKAKQHAKSASEAWQSIAAKNSHDINRVRHYMLANGANPRLAGNNPATAACETALAERALKRGDLTQANRYFENSGQSWSIFGEILGSGHAKDSQVLMGMGLADIGKARVELEKAKRQPIDGLVNRDIFMRAVAYSQSGVTNIIEARGADGKIEKVDDVKQFLAGMQDYCKSMPDAAKNHLGMIDLGRRNQCRLTLRSILL